ncbi:hypothetical protein HPP92_014057 [Vanilla planifolia]|uniref:Carotenoid cleavage dioxygenase 7 n=1 Tax=Vanilla planifolia TaxID=51239 RepID=A0A835UWI5_VANPL|nr:hypothetical protein HPP92_014494 [Vanilla planifolia]KAG0474371.1 hypothetical protein HPP92_014057 [Vanilla planifolia]
MLAFHRQLFFCPAAPPRLPPTSSFSLRRRIIAIPTAFTTSSPKHSASEHPEPDSASAAFQDYQLFFASQRAECPVPLPLRLVEGALPADFPRGTYYLVGPGMITDDHGLTVNFFDGHGYLRAFRFPGGGADGDVLYSARYVETEAVKEEREDGGRKWRFVRPGFFSLFKARRWPVPSIMKPKNVANTCVLRWGGRLFCLWEGGRPYELDPESLSTIGPVDFFSAAEEGGDGLKTPERFSQILFRS